MAIVIGSRVLDATGGAVSDITGYRVHTFTSSGNFVPSTSGSVEVLVVGGGGGSNTGTIGGGASGGSVLQSKFVDIVGGQPYSITVGTGGAQGSPGNNSTAFGYTAQGGRVGKDIGNGVDNPLGTGGGAGEGGTGGSGNNTIGVGFSGGNGGSFTAGGGGGAGSAGINGTGVGNGIGGQGILSIINGSPSYYGGGAGGGNNGVYHPTSSPSNKGLGSNSTDPGESGIVIVRYIR